MSMVQQLITCFSQQPPPTIAPMWKGTRPEPPPVVRWPQAFRWPVAAKPKGRTWEEIYARIEQESIGGFA